MKKVYEAPTVEKIAFQYRDQVVVASGLQEGVQYKDGDTGPCVFYGAGSDCSSTPNN